MQNTLTKEKKVVHLEKIQAEMLPELQGWREKQLQVVKENPFVEIEDNKTYEEAKKARTALVTARTTIEKQEKLIASKLRDFRVKVSEASRELIEITSPHEIKQQEEVRIYEAKKEAERLEKERIEQERKDAILKGINDFYQNWKSEIGNLNFKDIDNTKEALNSHIEDYSKNDLEEFEMDFAEKSNLLSSQLQERIKFLNEREAARVEREKLEAERRAFELQQKEAREKAEKEEAKRKAVEAKERAKREAEQREIDLQQKEAAQKLAKEREELEAEKQRIAKEKADEEAKAEAEKQAKIRAKEIAEAKKRADTMKPDVEKLKTVINAIGIHMEAPELKDTVSKTFFTELKLDIEDLKNSLHSKLANLK